MATEATKQIFNLIDAAKAKKHALEQRIRDLEKKKSQDRAELRREETLVVAEVKNHGDAGMHIRPLVDKQKMVWSDDHVLAELKRHVATVDKKIGEIIHWTSESEYADEQKRMQAVQNARQKFREIQV